MMQTIARPDGRPAVPQVLSYVCLCQFTAGCDLKNAFTSACRDWDYRYSVTLPRIYPRTEFPLHANRKTSPNLEIHTLQRTLHESQDIHFFATPKSLTKQEQHIQNVCSNCRYTPDNKGTSVAASASKRAKSPSTARYAVRWIAEHNNCAFDRAAAAASASPAPNSRQRLRQAITEDTNPRRSQERSRQEGRQDHQEGKPRSIHVIPSPLLGQTRQKSTRS